MLGICGRLDLRRMEAILLEKPEDSAEEGALPCMVCVVAGMLNCPI